MKLEMADPTPEVCPCCQAPRSTDTFKVEYKCGTLWMHVIPLRETAEATQHREIRRSEECVARQVSKYLTVAYLLRNTLRGVVANPKTKRQEGGDVDLEDYKEAQELLQGLEDDGTLGGTPAVEPPLAYPWVWHPPTERAETGRIVWVIECHPKKIYPQSYSIHAGTVGVAQGSDAWRVSQGDEAGCGWVSWYPAIDGSTADEQFIAWAYAEDFTPAVGLLPNIEG